MFYLSKVKPYVPVLAALLCASAQAQTAPATTPTTTPNAAPITTPPVTVPSVTAPPVTVPPAAAPDPTLPSYTSTPAPYVAPVIPKPAVAPVDSRLYAGAGATFGKSAYGIVIGSTQVFGRFGAQAGVEYSTQTGAMLVDTLLTFHPRGLTKSKLRPYVGVGLGLSSSAPVTGPIVTINGTTTNTPSVTDYTAQALVGSDFMLTSDIAAYAEGGYRHAFSSKGVANGAGALARLGIKFFF